MGETFVKLWNARKSNLEHDFAITAWALCVLPQVRADVKERMIGEHNTAIESIVKKLHVPPCPNKAVAPDGTPVSEMTLDAIVDLCWDEFKAFQKQTKPFDNVARWNSAHALAGLSHLWHEKYSLPYTAILGFVACRVTSKACGIGAAERSWGDVKHIKSGKRSNLSGKTVEKRAVIYTSARINDARIKRMVMEKIDAAGPNAMFGDDDFR